MKRQIKVLLFATLRDRIGSKSIEMELPEGATVKMLKEHIAKTYPGVKDVLDSVIVAIDRKFALDDQEIPQGGEVAIFPPVSGG
jgi:molybdopterin converting factor subunit 1